MDGQEQVPCHPWLQRCESSAAEGLGRRFCLMSDHLFCKFAATERLNSRPLRVGVGADGRYRGVGKRVEVASDGMSRARCPERRRRRITDRAQFMPAACREDTPSRSRVADVANGRSGHRFVIRR